MRAAKTNGKRAGRRSGSRARAAEDLNLDGYLPYLINRTGAALAEAFSVELRAVGLSLPQWRVAVALLHAGPQRQTDLAKLASIEASTISRVIGAMQRADLVVRRRSAISNREVSVALTARGSKVTRKLIPEARRYEAVLMRGMKAGELRVVRHCLRQFHVNIMRSLSRAIVAPRKALRESSARTIR